MNPVFYFVVDHSIESGFRPEKPDLVRKFAESKKHGKRFAFVVKSDRPALNRSALQNRYYFGVVVKFIAEATGDDPQSTHEALAYKWLPLSLKSSLRARRSTTDLSTEEFSDYIDTVRHWAHGFLSLDIPGPNDIDMDSVTGFIPD